MSDSRPSILNPFTMTADYDLSQDEHEHHSDENENLLELSIDTLSRVQPVDMSNMEEFETCREEEEKQDVCFLFVFFVHSFFPEEE